MYYTCVLYHIRWYVIHVCDGEVVGWEDHRKDKVEAKLDCALAGLFYRISGKDVTVMYCKDKTSWPFYPPIRIAGVRHVFFFFFFLSFLFFLIANLRQNETIAEVDRAAISVSNYIGVQCSALDRTFRAFQLNCGNPVHVCALQAVRSHGVSRVTVR